MIRKDIREKHSSNLQKKMQKTKMNECKKRLQKEAQQANQLNVCPSMKG